MRLTTKNFVEFLSEGVDIHTFMGRIPDMPNRAIAVIKTSGGNDPMNGIFEEIIYRVQTRGQSNSIDDAERIAYLVDDFLHNRTMFDIGDVYVLSSVHVSPPRQINITDPQSRFNFTADYRVTAGRD